jgi:hypothetical protein
MPIWDLPMPWYNYYLCPQSVQKKGEEGKRLHWLEVHGPNHEQVPCSDPTDTFSCTPILCREFLICPVL